MLNNLTNTTEFGAVVENKTLKNTMTLLTLTVLFSAAMAYINTHLLIAFSPIITIVLYFALLFAIHKTQNSGLSILFTFALTGLLGFTLGPILSLYMQTSEGMHIVTNALIGTAATFAITSFYAYTKRPTIKGVWMSNLFWVSLVACGLSLVNYYFLQMSALSIVISAVFLFVSVFFLTYEMSAIFRNDPNVNYVLATVGIYVSLYNIFLSLLNILGALRN